MKNQIFIIALGVFIFISISQTAIGANWVKIHEDERSKLYVNLDNIIRTKKDTVKYWEKKVEKNIKEITHALYFLETDCKEIKERILQGTLYSKDGSTKTFAIPSEWYSYMPDTSSEDRYKIVCP
ncbi:MAG: surface-adhesin E family protein [Candidatus Hodarchaeales archaeon]|jgi:hypothetical protein